MAAALVPVFLFFVFIVAYPVNGIVGKYVLFFTDCTFTEFRNSKVVIHFSYGTKINRIIPVFSLSCATRRSIVKAFATIEDTN